MKKEEKVYQNGLNLLTLLSTRKSHLYFVICDRLGGNSHRARECDHLCFWIANFSRHFLAWMQKRRVFVGASEFDPPIEHFVGRKDIDVGWRAEVCVRVEVKAVSRARGTPPLRVASRSVFRKAGPPSSPWLGL